LTLSASDQRTSSNRDWAAAGVAASNTPVAAITKIVRATDAIDPERRVLQFGDRELPSVF
jgi:hypothetical protein